MAYSKVRTRTTQQHAAENTGYTYSLSSSYSSAALEYEREHRLAPVFDSPRMSRRSLRLQGGSGHYHDNSGLGPLYDTSVSFSTGGSVQKERKTKSRRSGFSMSGSSSLLQTPVKTPHKDIYDASDSLLTSSLLNESCIQEHTVVKRFWGLDEDGDLKDQTVREDRSFTSINNGDVNTAQTQTSTMNSTFLCKECTTAHSERDPLPAHSSSQPCPSSSCFYSSSALNLAASDGSFSPNITVYSREKSRRHKSGVLGLLSEACLRYSRKTAASVVCLFTLLMQNVLLKPGQQGKAMLWSMTDWCVCVSRRVAVSSAAALTLLVQSARLRKACSVNANGGHAGYCGTMNVNDLITQKEHQSLSGPLCDDCKGKQNLKTSAVYTRSSMAQQFIGALWFLVFFTGKAASRVFWWLGTAWYQLVTLMSLLNVFFLTRCLPVLRKLLWILLPLLLLLALWFWGLPSFWAILPAVNMPEWMTTDSLLGSLSAPASMDSQGLPGSHPSLVHHEDAAKAAAAYSERLAQIEQSLAQLWEHVAATGSKREQQHKEVLSLYSSLTDKLHTHTNRESLGQWVDDLMEQRVRLLRVEMEKEKQQLQQHEEEFELQNLDNKSRLAEVEALLKNLALKMEELQRRQESQTPSSDSVEVDHTSHATLLAEVHKLEEKLGSIRIDLQGVIDCKGKCEQLDSIHDTVSEQVRQELRSLLYGKEHPEGTELPDSLLKWLSTQFVSSSDLQASLAALERSILGNVSYQMEKIPQKPCAETITRAVLQSTEQAGLSEENVQLIVQNALKLYSQDRIGLVDYALESGGGSVLSTRCSETYETKTALMSLFGLPLWYFSQSPRAVIQPDVHPGNCWAFRGSHGYLVIRLSLKIVPTAFSLEHIPKTLSPTGNINSAPRNFTVYGLEDEQQEEGQVLGQYVYQVDGEPLQTYQVKENTTNAYQIIELRVLSNWGHPEYTCLYRFRVHGEPVLE